MFGDDLAELTRNENGGRVDVRPRSGAVDARLRFSMIRSATKLVVCSRQGVLTQVLEGGKEEGFSTSLFPHETNGS